MIYNEIIKVFKKNKKYLISWIKYKLFVCDLYYYDFHKSLIPDYEYDYLYNILINLKKHSINYIENKINVKDIKNSNKHLSPMLSLNSTSNFLDLKLFIKNVSNLLYINYFFIKKIFYLCELKFDGVSISLIYENNRLIRGLTRGDGTFGEDVTHNIYNISSIPKFLNFIQFPIIDIRGELVILKNDFLYINNYREKIFKKKFINPRNTVSGILKRKYNKFYLRFLTFYAHGIGYVEGDFKSKSQSDLLILYSRLGFKTSPFIKLTSSFYDLVSFFKFVNDIRFKLNYDIDGIVIKVNKFLYQRIIGFNIKAPKFCIACKFFTCYALSDLLDIKLQVSKSGLITPVGVLESVFINNVIINKVSLHNFFEIKRKNISIGDTLLIYRAGDTIPQVLKIFKKNNISKEFKFPNFCYICKSKLILEKKKKQIFCSGGLFCIAQKKNILIHFCSKLAFNIKGLGVNILNKLFDENIVVDLIDLFLLNYDKFINLKNFKKKLIDKILKSIDISKTILLSRFIYSLSIRNIGFLTSKRLAFYFKKISLLINATEFILKKIPWITDSIINSLFLFFNEFNNRLVIYNLLFFINIING